MQNIEDNLVWIKANKQNIPKESGIYQAYSCDDNGNETILFIGSTRNLNVIINNHLNEKSILGDKFKFMSCDELQHNYLTNILINRFNPAYNILWSPIVFDYGSLKEQ